MRRLFCLAVLLTTATVRFCCGDETRIGLKTISKRKITAIGVKPIGMHQRKFQATYLDGIVESLSGEHFFWDFSHRVLNSDCNKRVSEFGCSTIR